MNKDVPNVLLAHHLKALKLPTILREYESMAQLCAKERSGYAEFLLRLTERELIEREQRASERRIRQAMFPVLKTLDSFDFTMQPSINEASVRELIRGEFVQRKENVLLVGNPGTGKSHLATALGHAVCMQGLKVKFFSVTGLVTTLLEHREERTLQRFKKQLERYHLIILDELGYVPFSKTGTAFCFKG
jgi:DNA replication protein DnaC